MRTEAVDEQELIQRVRHDPDAFRVLYCLYFDRVYAYVAYRVGSREDAEDITAEVFTRVVEKMDRFQYRGEGSFAAWLFQIAHNQVCQFYRKHHPQSEPRSLDELPDIRSRTLLPDQVLSQKEQFMRLRGAIRALSPRRQEIVTLKFFGGLRNREIARVLGLNERTVASHLCRAIDDLRRIYRIQPEREGLR